MDKFVDGNRVQTFADETVITTEWLNEFQDQIKQALGPRKVNLLTNFQNLNSGFLWSLTTDGSDYLTTGTNSATVIFPVVIPASCKITQIQTIISGDSGITGGTIDFFYGTTGVDKNVINLDGGSSTPWAEEDYPWVDRTTYTITTGDIPLTINSDTYAYFYFQAGSNVDNPYSGRIWEVSATYQYYSY